jgi:hypothetical protein
MIHRALLTLLAVLALTVSSSARADDAGPPGARPPLSDPIGGKLFPPELIMVTREAPH